jgi:Asp-tRNA(Asn)/Glu-tRNA(Gln) amidotransferase A subunit family amidase
MNPRPRRRLPPIIDQNNSIAVWTATEFLAQLRARQISVEEYCMSCADISAQIEGDVRAWTWWDPDLLRQRAREADALLRQLGGEENVPGSLCGVPIGVKDIFNTADMPTKHGSAIFAGYTPGNDARAVTSLRRRGGIIAGKLETSEFAVHAAPGTRNPWDLARSTGTSSSGSAAAVAACMVPVALSSQTAASTIRPSSYCGVYGFKPSYGTIPRTAMLKTTDTLDSVAMITRSVADAALLFDALRVAGPNYPIVDRELSDPRHHAVGDAPWRVAVVEGAKSHLEHSDVKRGIESVARWLEQRGVEVTKLRLPVEFDGAHDVHRTIYHKALSYYFKMEWERAGEAFSQLLADIVVEGRQIAVEDYVAALGEQARLAKQFDRMLEQRFDVLLCPSAADVAPVGIDAPDPADYSLIWTMCYAPTMSLPLCHDDHGLPIGVQIVARRFDDYKLLKFAELLDEFPGHE